MAIEQELEATKAARRKARLFLLPLLIFVALALLLLFGLGNDPREVPSPLIGKPIPNFTLPELRDGQQRTVSDQDLRGTISLVNVWASWCFACRQEHPQLMALSQRDDIQIFGLNWKDDKQDALKVLRDTGDPYKRIGFDPDNKVGIDWGVYGAPETFLVDPNGMIRHKHIGPISPEIWEEQFLPKIQRIKRGQ